MEEGADHYNLFLCQECKLTALGAHLCSCCRSVLVCRYCAQRAKPPVADASFVPHPLIDNWARHFIPEDIAAAETIPEFRQKITRGVVKNVLVVWIGSGISKQQEEYVHARISKWGDFDVYAKHVIEGKEQGFIGRLIVASPENGPSDSDYELVQVFRTLINSVVVSSCDNRYLLMATTK